MKVLSVALAATYSAVLSLTGIDTSGPVGFILSDDQTTSDTFELYGTLDSAATDNTNAQLLGVFRGGTSNLPKNLADQARTWPFLLIRRTGGSTAGSLTVAGNPAASPAAVTAAAPVLAAGYSAVLNLTTLGALDVRIGGSRQMTVSDVFDVFLSNDSTLASSTGAYYAGRITGGGGTNLNTIRFSGLNYAIVQRVSGSTAGNIIAAGVSPSGSGGGTLNLTTRNVGDTAAPGAIGGLTAAQTVDIYSSLLAVQTTVGVVGVTLPNPSDTTAGKVVLVMNAPGAQPFVMYGMVMGPGSVQLFEWTGAAWVGGRNVTQGGNAFGQELFIGTLDVQNVTLQSNTTGAVTVDSGTTGPVNIGTGLTGAGKSVTIGAVNGTNALALNAGSTGIAGSSSGPIQLTTGNNGNIMLTAAGSGGIMLQPGATGQVGIPPRAAGAGNTTEVAFRELAANGANYTALKAADAITANVTLTLPDAAPARSGQVIEVTTAGVMSFNGVINVIATNTNAQSIVQAAPATNVTTWTEVQDTAGAFDPAAGTFTVPAGGSGLYLIEAQLQYAATAADLGVTFDASIAIGGVIQRTGRSVNPVAALAQTRAVPIAAQLQLAAGNVVSIQAALSANGGGNIALTNSALFNFLSISRIGA